MVRDTPSNESWSIWPTYAEDAAEAADYLAEHRRILDSITAHYGQEKLQLGFRKVCNMLRQRDSVTTGQIPDLRFEDLRSLSEELREKVKEAGCLVVRNVIDADLVKELFRELKNYLSENSDVSGAPDYNPCMKRIYWSKLQVLLRQHPNQLELQDWINHLFTDTSGDSDMKEICQPLTYADGLRISPPKSRCIHLGPHIDSGSLARWGENKYRQVYDAVFRGMPEELDMYDLAARKEAELGKYRSVPHDRIFRGFQGWTALTSIGNDKSGLFLRPHIKETIAYILLRPFFRPTKAPTEDGYLDANNWKFDIRDASFPGTLGGNSQMVSTTMHPHLSLERTFVSIPELEAGDTVFWHSDLVHAVGVEHNGDHESGVVYIPACHSTDSNIKYVRKQAEFFKRGLAPQDYHQIAGTCDETKLKGYPGGVNLLTEAGKRALQV